MLSNYLPSSAVALGPMLIAGIVTLILFARYLVFAGSALWFVTANRKALEGRQIQSVPFTARQLRREAVWSALSAVVFGLVGLLAHLANRQLDFLASYSSIETHGWFWFWCSIPIAILVHDFYFYWAHRLMHAPAVYKRVHKVHHLSTNPSPLSAFAFHPYEAVLEALGFVLILALVPMHPLAFVIFSTFMIAFNVMGHLGYELLPRFLVHVPVLRLLNTATCHNQHHRTFRYNYGLYTLIWDRMFGTLHPHYTSSFRHPALAAPSTLPLLDTQRDHQP
jgi:sterol desaturase/sphingolipid hydroxylase (fatty acid hydroxylase superfamily)